MLYPNDHKQPIKGNWDTLKAQNAPQIHRRIVACESPLWDILACKLCPRLASVITYGVGCRLLDGRNPQRYNDELKRFEELQVSTRRWKGSTSMFAFCDAM